MKKKSLGAAGVFHRSQCLCLLYWTRRIFAGVHLDRLIVNSQYLHKRLGMYVGKGLTSRAADMTIDIIIRIQ